MSQEANKELFLKLLHISAQASVDGVLKKYEVVKGWYSAELFDGGMLSAHVFHSEKDIQFFIDKVLDQYSEPLTIESKEDFFRIPLRLSDTVFITFSNGHCAKCFRNDDHSVSIERKSGGYQIVDYELIKGSVVNVKKKLN